MGAVTGPIRVAVADRLAEAAAVRPALLLGYMKERDDAVTRLRELLADVGDVRAVEVRVLHPSGRSQLAFANLRPPPDDVPPDAVSGPRSRSATLLDTALGGQPPEWLRELYEKVVVGSLVHNTSLLRHLFCGIAEVDDVRVWPDDAFPPSVLVNGVLTSGARTVRARRVPPCGDRGRGPGCRSRRGPGRHHHQPADRGRLAEQRGVPIGGEAAAL